MNDHYFCVIYKDKGIHEFIVPFKSVYQLYGEQVIEEMKKQGFRYIQNNKEHQDYLDEIRNQK